MSPVPPSATSSAGKPGGYRPRPRAPQFLSALSSKVNPPAFTGGIVGRTVTPFLEFEDEPEEAGAELPIATEPPPGLAPLAPPLPPPPPQPGPEFAERLAAAVAELRLQSQQLAEQARFDAVEIALAVAERVLERELATGPGALEALIQSAVRRIGETRKISIRLCPSDVAAVEAAGEAGMVRSNGIARVELIADASLSPGDCVVEGDHGTADGRLSSRLEELRRVLLSALTEAAEEP